MRMYTRTNPWVLYISKEEILHMAFFPHSVFSLTVVLEVINRQTDKLKIQKFNCG